MIRYKLYVLILSIYHMSTLFKGGGGGGGGGGRGFLVQVSNAFHQVIPPIITYRLNFNLIKG